MTSSRPKTSNERGSEFEQAVGVILRDLQAKFPTQVKVTAQPDFRDYARPHRPDFELEYKLGGLTHQHLIECQNRTRSSHEVADKIYAVRGDGKRHRYILVYQDPDYLTDSVRERLTRMGVLIFDILSFKTQFISQLEADLALHWVGRLALTLPQLQDKLRQQPNWESRVRSAASYDSRRSNPPDSAQSAR